jgi:hypothetical protein
MTLGYFSLLTFLFCVGAGGLRALAAPRPLIDLTYNRLVRPPRLRAVAIALSAVFALSACGNRFVPAAAVVDGRRISESTLEHALAILLTDPQFAQQATGSTGEEGKKDLTRQELGFLIRREIAQEYADAHGIVVTSQDVDQTLQSVISSLGGQSAFDQLLSSRGLTLEDVRDILAQQVLLQKVGDAVVAERLGASAAGATAQQRDTEFNQWLIDRLAAADIVVNPRFGRFDPDGGSISPATSTAE